MYCHVSWLAKTQGIGEVLVSGMRTVLQVKFDGGPIGGFAHPYV